MRHLNPGSATKINQQNPVQAAWWTLREDSEIQLIHGRIKHNSTEILRSDVRKNVATMNLSFNTRAGSNPVSGLHQETRCYHWITRVISIMCHVMSGSRDSVTRQLQSCHTYRDTWHNSWQAWQPSHLMSRPRLFASLMPLYSLPKFCRLKLRITLPTFNHLHARMDEMAPGQFVCFPAPGPH